MKTYDIKNIKFSIGDRLRLSYNSILPIIKKEKENKNQTVLFIALESSLN